MKISFIFPFIFYRKPLLTYNKSEYYIIQKTYYLFFFSLSFKTLIKVKTSKDLLK